MRKLLFPIAGVALVSDAVLLMSRAEATVSSAPSSIRGAVGQTNAVENAACLPRRVCVEAMLGSSYDGEW